jgi:hypothetical protein
MQTLNLAVPEGIAQSKEVKLSGILARNQSYVNSQQPNNIGPEQFTTFELPQELLDLRSATFQFKITGTPGVGSTYNRFNQDIRSIISRIIVRFGSKVVVDTHAKNLWYNITNYTKPVNWATSVGRITNGVGSTTERNALFSNPNYVYAVQLYNMENSFFNKVLPLNKLGVQCYIDIYFAQPNQCIESDAGSPTYVVNAMQFHYSSLVPDDNWNQMYNTQVSQGGCTYTYCNVENINDTSLMPAGVSSVSKILTYKYTSLVGVVAVMRPLANMSNFAANDKLNNYAFNNVNTAYVKIGSQQYPINSNQSGSDMLTMFAEQFGLSMRVDFAGATNWLTGSPGSFVVCIPLAKHIKEFDRVKGISVDGLDTSIGTSVIINLQFSTPLAAAMQVDFFALYEAQVTFNQNGSITWNT